MSQVFRPAGLMLTAAIGAAPGTIDAAYDVERMYEYLDYVHGEAMWAGILELILYLDLSNCLTLTSL